MSHDHQCLTLIADEYLFGPEVFDLMPAETPKLRNLGERCISTAVLLIEATRKLSFVSVSETASSILAPFVDSVWRFENPGNVEKPQD